ncbi:MAG: NADH-quinone oxidoreductase subunit J [Gammaproteobacteria bacterium]|nr:NADH-quinone oxidoreductase subunit J [Gammaproteobacteria bacterium]NND59162.1 NADH-quinone oxidoreductase subunit J [Gammaproteobacteria bacterium]
MEAGIFYLFATVLVGAAVGVISSRNPVHAALFLVLAFVTSAVLWILLEAEFLGIVLVLVYVGAVMVLFLFVVMMLNVNIEKMRVGFTRYAPLGIIVALAVAAEIGYVIWTRRGQLPEKQPLPADNYSNTEALGAVLYTDYVYAFELAAIILLVAIVAAIALTMRQRAGVKAQDISAQVATRRQDRVRLVSMDSEPRQ